MHTIRRLILLFIFLTFISSSEALQCYCGSNATRVVQCEASRPTDLCVTYKVPCSPGDTISEECKQLNPPTSVYIFHYNYLSTCEDPTIPYYYNPQCCSTDYCNAPPGTPINAPKSQPRPNPTTQNSYTNIALYIILAVTIVVITSGTLFLLVRRCRSVAQANPEESEGLISGVELAEEILGRGSNSIVIRAKKDGKLMAKKIITNPQLWANLGNERSILNQLNNLSHHIIREGGLQNSSLYLELCDCSK